MVQLTGGLSSQLEPLTPTRHADLSLTPSTAKTLEDRRGIVRVCGTLRAMCAN